MKKAFTLVELLVVVVVIVTLMTITFKLAGAGGDSTARSKTLNRMQRLENCLSGYYAAYGSYPPVKLHGSRDYTYKANSRNLLQDVGNGSRISGSLSENWNAVEAACRSQPLDFSYPFNDDMTDFMDAYCQVQRERDSSSPLYVALVNNTTLSGKQGDEDWTAIQLFRYGVMSYLLPRYLITMKDAAGKGEQSGSPRQQLFTKHKSWTSNNQIPCQFETGAPYTGWDGVYSDVNQYPWKVAALPSQAATARWMPNLEGICYWMTEKDLYGIDIRDHDEREVPKETYSSGDSYDSSSQCYKLNKITVNDGYGEAFYYYSLPPHQTYRLWSAGANKKTFPPWITDEELNDLNAADRKTVQTWISDDIVHMSN